MYVIRFTDGTYLRIFPTDDTALYYSDDYQILEPNGNKVIANAFAGIRDLQGNWIFDFGDGKTDLDGHFWTRVGNTIKIYDTEGGTQLFSVPCDGLVAVYSSSPSLYPSLSDLYLQSYSWHKASFEPNFYNSFFYDGENADGDIFEDEINHARTVSRNCVNVFIDAEGNPIAYVDYFRREQDLPSIINMTYGTPSGGAFDISTLSLENSIDEVVLDDPYSPAGISSGGGGTGTFYDVGGKVGIPSLPTLSAVDTGFVTLYSPTIGQLQGLAAYLWSGAFDLNTFKKIFADPMDAILGLAIVPVAVTKGANVQVKIGNVECEDVYMYKASTQYEIVDCGTIKIDEKWGAYLDFDPYTKLSLYLPYIGIRPVSADVIIGKNVHIVYHVDIFSGACVAFVEVNGEVQYSYIGQCSTQVPITSNSWNNMISSMLTIAGSIGSMVATGGASAPMALGAIASASVNGMKQSYGRSGAMSGTGGMLAGQTPYFIVSRPNQALPESQNKFSGYPSFITETLGTLSGYTEIDSIHLENVPATSDELNEIENLLKGGVIL